MALQVMENTAEMDPSQAPLVSVIIPSYNRADQVLTAIQSALDQSYPNLEVIVVDDFSTDHSMEVLKSLEDPRVQIFSNQKRKGAQGARNTGLMHAQGEYIAMLDSDDRWHPEKIEKQYAILSKGEYLGIGCAFQSFSTAENFRVKVYRPEKSEVSFDDLLYENVIGGFSVFMCTKSLAEEVGGFQEEFPSKQDIAFYLALARRGKLWIVPEVLSYQYKADKGRITENPRKKLDGNRIFYQQFKADLMKHKRARARIGVQIFFYALAAQPFRSWLYLPFVYLAWRNDPKSLRWLRNKLIEWVQKGFRL